MSEQKRTDVFTKDTDMQVYDLLTYYLNVIHNTPDEVMKDHMPVAGVTLRLPKDDGSSFGNFHFAIQLVGFSEGDDVTHPALRRGVH